MISEPVRFASERRGRFKARVAVFIAAAALGGAAVGLALGSLGEEIATAHLGAAGATAGLDLLLCVVVAYALARELRRPHWPVPQLSWQVPRVWMRRFWLGAIAFGSIMGSGLFTYQPTALFWIYAMSLLSLHNPSLGAILGGTYGVAFSVGTNVYGYLWRMGAPGSQYDRAQDLLARIHLAATGTAVAALFVVIAWSIV